MSHPIPDTNDSHSVQVILPQKQLGRKSDMCVASTHISCILFNHGVEINKLASGIKIFIMGSRATLATLVLVALTYFLLLRFVLRDIILN